MRDCLSADVSVVIPHFNAIETVGRSIESVIAQTLPVHELLIVDDASADFQALARLVARYSNQLKITLLPLGVNGGAANARNVGVAGASSTYIAFLDSDDVWHPQKIALQYAYMRTHSVNLTAHGYIFDLRQRPFSDVFRLTVKTIVKGRFIWGNPIFTPTVMARRDSFFAFDGRHQRMEDYRCWYENLRNGNHELLSLDLAGGFKPAIGESGLTASARLMHQGYLEVLHSLRAEGKMPLFDYLLAVLCEALKYPIRSLLIFIRK